MILSLPFATRRIHASRPSCFDIDPLDRSWLLAAPRDTRPTRGSAIPFLRRCGKNGERPECELRATIEFLFD